MAGPGPMVTIVSETNPSDTELGVPREMISGKQSDDIWQVPGYVGIE